MQVDARDRLPGALVLVGVGVVIASTFLPWGEATQPLVVSRESFGGWFLAGLAALWGGVVGLVMLVRGPHVPAAVVGVLVALLVGFAILSFANELIPDLGPGLYVSAVGVIVMLIGSVIGLAKRRVAAASAQR